EDDGKASLDGINDEGQLEIPINQDDKTKTVEKQGVPKQNGSDDENAFGSDKIDWTVTINKENMSLDDAKIEDQLPEGTEYESGSLKVTKVKTSLNGTVLDEEEVTGISESVNDGTLTVPLGDIEDQYRIEYTTIITDQDKSPFKNNVTFEDADYDDVSASDEISIEFN